MPRYHWRTLATGVAVNAQGTCGIDVVHGDARTALASWKTTCLAGREYWRYWLWTWRQTGTIFSLATQSSPVISADEDQIRNLLHPEITSQL